MIEERKNRIATPNPDTPEESSEKKKKKKDKKKGKHNFLSKKTLPVHLHCEF